MQKPKNPISTQIKEFFLLRFNAAVYEESESFEESATIQRGDEILELFNSRCHISSEKGRAKCRGPIIPRQFQGCQISTRIFTEFGNTPKTWTLESKSEMFQKLGH